LAVAISSLLRAPPPLATVPQARIFEGISDLGWTRTNHDYHATNQPTKPLQCFSLRDAERTGPRDLLHEKNLVSPGERGQILLLHT